jgi:hypothetical protein
MEEGEEGKSQNLLFPSSPFEVENPVVSFATSVHVDFPPRILLFCS